jgi:Zn-dependent protease
MFNVSDLPKLVLSVLAVLIALTVHEFSHGYVAYKLGDNTAARYGRLTLNPIKHLDIYGAICMLFFHFGWAKPVPINPRNFKKPKRDFALCAIGGPLSNLIIAFLFAFFYLLAYKYFRFTDNELLNNILYNTLYFLAVFHTVNIGLGVFNLLPIPPFDGSRILNVILPEKWYFKIMKYERKIYLGVIIWLLLGGYLYGILTSIPMIAASPILSGILKIFSLSTLISEAVEAISALMLSFWKLLPFLR